MTRVEKACWRFLCCGMAGLLALTITACKKSAAEKASESDANGYVCDSGHKFYTDRKIFADRCPVCTTVKLTEVYGFVCEVDPASKPENWTPGCGHVTLAPRFSQLTCEKCGRPVSAVLLPAGKALSAWGATKATRQQVALPPR